MDPAIDVMCCWSRCIRVDGGAPRCIHINAKSSSMIHPINPRQTSSWLAGPFRSHPDIARFSSRSRRGENRQTQTGLFCPKANRRICLHLVTQHRLVTTSHVTRRRQGLIGHHQRHLIRPLNLRLSINPPAGVRL